MEAPVIAVFLTIEGMGLPHLDVFRACNPDVPTFCFEAPLLPLEKRSQAWRNCDRNIRDWWRGTGQGLAFGFAVFLEADVYFADSIGNIFEGEADFTGKDLKKPGMYWNWLSEIPRLPPEFREHATGMAPLAVLRISRRCLKVMFEHPMVDEVYSRDIFCELRLPTLAAACGFEPVGNRPRLSGVGCGPARPKAHPGVWHAVKKPLQ